MTQNEVSRLAKLGARKYRRKCDWVEEEELEQEAWKAILYARKSFDSTRGTPEGAYIWRAIMRHLCGFVWAQSAPVSASVHCREELSGLTKVPIKEAISLFSQEGNPEETLWKKEVRRELFSVANSANANGFLSAKFCDIAVRDQKEKCRFFRAASQDLTLYEMWKEA